MGRSHPAQESWPNSAKRPTGRSLNSPSQRPGGSKLIDVDCAKPVNRDKLPRMSERKTRREVLKGGLALAAAASLPGQALSQQKEQAAVDTAPIEKQLAHPLNDEAKKLLAEAVKANREAGVERLKTKCPENSEPAFAFSPRPKEKRSW